MKPVTPLTTEQKKILTDMWNSDPRNPPTLGDIVAKLFGPGLDGRSVEAKAVKIALAELNLSAKTKSKYEVQTDKIILTEEQKKFIENNSSVMNALEIAKILFKNPALSNLNCEVRAVSNYIQDLNIRVLNCKKSDLPKQAEYTPPKTIDAAIKRINTYITYVVDREKVTPTQRKNIDTLIGYLHTYRFISQMNNYETETERTLCEDAFIRATYDKPDLAQEEIDQYIEYANQVVQGFNIQRRSNTLQAHLDMIAGGGEESMKISMGLVEAIGKASNEYHQCKSREQKLLDDLKEKRSNKLAKNIKDNASILNLVQAWKNEETRLEMLAHAEKEQKAIANEVNKMSDMSELKLRILGLSKNDILNG